jgi:hypothetical protein
MSDTEKSEQFNGHSLTTAGGYDDSTCDKCGVGIKQVDTPCVSFPYIGNISDNRAVVDVERLEAHIQALITQRCNQARFDEAKQDWLVLNDECEMCVSNMDARNRRIAQLQAKETDKSNIIIHPSGVGEIIVDEAKETAGE